MPITNDIGVRLCGFVKTRAELDTVVGQGQSLNIDHDTDIFYLALNNKLGDESNKHIIYLKSDESTYAITMGNFTYFYFGPGANSGSSHQTDFDFVSIDDGQTWTPVESSVSIDGKTASIEVVKYDESITDNYEEKLKGAHKTVFGPQEMVCDQSRNFSYSDISAYDDSQSRVKAMTYEDVARLIGKSFKNFNNKSQGGSWNGGYISSEEIDAVFESVWK